MDGGKSCLNATVNVCATNARDSIPGNSRSSCLEHGYLQMVDHTAECVRLARTMNRRHKLWNKSSDSSTRTELHCIAVFDAKMKKKKKKKKREKTRRKQHGWSYFVS